jgi:O-antigen ligase
MTRRAELMVETRRASCRLLVSNMQRTCNCRGLGFQLAGRDWSEWPSRLAAWLLFAAVALAPLPFGSSQQTAVAFWCIVLGTSALFMPIGALEKAQLAFGAIALVVVAAYAIVLHEQLAPHPWLPFSHPDPIWLQAQSALNEPLVPLVSIARNQPWLELGRPLVCVLAITCGFVVGNDPIRARQLYLIVAWSGTTYAAYGILAHLFDPTHILWLEKDAYLDSVTSTFINRNTAGAYFGTSAVVCSLLLWDAARRRMPRGSIDWRILPRQILSGSSKILTAQWALCLMALLMSGSRAAVLISLLSLVLVFVIFFWRKLPRGTGITAALAGGGAVALLLLQLVGGSVNGRFDAQGFSDEGRLSVYQSALHMIADHPMFGTGQGTFANAFPAYRSPAVTIWGVWDMVHNSLLQIATDMGLPVAVIVILSWVAIFALILHGIRVRRTGLIFAVTGFGVATIAVLHSFVDFSLQIPGYAIMALSVIGAGAAQCFSRRDRLVPESASR